MHSPLSHASERFFNVSFTGWGPVVPIWLGNHDNDSRLFSCPALGTMTSITAYNLEGIVDIQILRRFHQTTYWLFSWLAQCHVSSPILPGSLPFDLWVGSPRAHEDPIEIRGTGVVTTRHFHDTSKREVESDNGIAGYCQKPLRRPYMYYYKGGTNASGKKDFTTTCMY